MTLRLIVLASALARFPASRHSRPDLPHATASGNAGSESIATLARTNRTHAKSTATIEAYGPIANWHVLDANGTAGSRRRTVLFSQILSAIDNFMYSPVVDTLKRGFEALGARVRIHAGPTGAVRSAGSLLLGDVLIFVGMCGGVCGKLPLVKLGKRGVLRIKYNTEPSVNANGTTSLPRCLTHGEFDEVWDYSLANIAPCVPDSLRGRRHALAVNNGSNERRLVF